MKKIKGWKHEKEFDTRKMCIRDSYYTTVFAEKYAAENGLPLIKVQHHHAHVASVMAENDLKGKVIGVSFDGTGYGTDGHIWGGEFFLCENGDAKRIAHLKYVDMIGGDASVKDARRSALSYIHAFENGYMPVDLTGAESENSREIAVDISDIIKSVSYTHLDVYKRQSYDCR